MIDDSDIEETKDEDIIVSRHFPGRERGTLEGVNSAFSYNGCMTCGSKKEEEMCVKCHKKTETKVNFVLKVAIATCNDLVNRTFFHDDVIALLGEKETSTEVENAALELVGRMMVYHVNDNNGSNVSLE